MSRRIINNFNSKDYEHSADRKAIEAIKHMPGMASIIKKFYQIGIERMDKILYTGSNLRVNKTNFPSLYNLLQEVCYVLNVEKMPKFYIQRDPYINAFTTGIEYPIIVINSACVDALTDDELIYILGHEVGHIISGHQLYHSMASILPDLGSLIGGFTLGIGELPAKAIEYALLSWFRKSEFTADRAGLLACQDIDAVISALMKISGVPNSYYHQMNPKDFIEQAKEFDNFDMDSLDKVAKIISTFNLTHPWTVIRASELLRWVEAGEYKKILYR